MLNLIPESTAPRVMCMYMSADRSAAHLAILHVSHLTIFSMPSMQGIIDHNKSATAAPAAPRSANTAAQNEYADITSAIQLSKGPEPQAHVTKRKQQHRLQVFIACGGPPVVLDDHHR